MSYTGGELAIQDIEDVDRGGDVLVGRAWHLREIGRQHDPGDPGNLDDGPDQGLRDSVQVDLLRTPALGGQQVEGEHGGVVGSEVIGVSVGAVGAVGDDDVGTFLSQQREDAVRDLPPVRVDSS